MRERPELPNGWSFPIKPSEVEWYVPGVGHVNWVRGNEKLQDLSARDQSVLYLAWQPWTAMPASILTIGAVPSEFRAEIRQWIDEVVGPEAMAWMKELESRTPTRLDRGHNVSWTWRRDLIPDGPSTVYVPVGGRELRENPARRSCREHAYRVSSRSLGRRRRRATRPAPRFTDPRLSAEVE